MSRLLRGPLNYLSVQLSLVGILVAAPVTVVALMLIGASLNRDLDLRAEAEVSRVQAQMDQRFGVYGDLLLIATTWLGSQAEVGSAVEAGEYDAALQQVIAAFERIDINEQNVTLRIYDSNGAPAARTPNTPPPGEDEAAVQDVLRSGAASRGISSETPGSLHIATIAPIQAPNGGIQGAIESLVYLDERFADDYASGLATSIAVVTEGETIAGSNAQFVPSDGLDPAILTGDRIDYINTASGPYLGGAVPLSGFDGEPIGHILVGIPESEIDAGLNDILGRILPLLIGTAAIAILLSMAGFWLVTRPLRRLVDAARDIQSNDLDRPVPVGGPGEVRSLAEAMEDMRLAIRQSRETLISANQEMASRFDASTADLSEITQTLGVLRQVLDQIDDRAPGGLADVTQMMTELDWIDGAFMALANQSGGLSVDAAAGIPSSFASVLVDTINAGIADQAIEEGIYIPETGAEDSGDAQLASLGIGGFAAQPLVTRDGIAGLIGVTAQRDLPLTPQREEVLRSIAREIARTLERTELADEVEESRRIAESVLREMSDGVLVLDDQGFCRICNPAAARLLDRPRAALIGQQAADILPLTDSSLEALRRRATAPPGAAIAPLVIQVEDRRISLASSPFFDPDPARAGMIIMLRDLSAEAEAERIKQDFVSMVGHELRTPLTLIRTTIDLLYEGDTGTLSETQERVVGVLRNNSERLMTLISDLLDMSALDSGRQQIQPDVTNLGEAVTIAVENLQPAAATKQHEIHVEVAPGVIVWADRARIEQIASNLVGNAIKYTRPGGEIHVTVEQHVDEAIVSVQDNGIGIAPEEQEHLFEKFYRTSAGRHTTGGTGLGLAIARSLVELHGGAIRCESDGVSGSRFTFTIPLAKIGAVEV